VACRRGRSANFVWRRPVSADHARRRKLGGRAAVAAAWLWLGARRRRLTASSPVPGAREPSGLEWWADRASVAAFDCGRTRECLSSRRAVISPKRSAISSTARDAPLCDVLPRVPITRYPTISPRSPTGSNSEPQTGHRSPIRSASLSVPCKRVFARQTFEMRHRRPLLVVRLRHVRVAGIARTDRVCLGPGAVRSPRVQTGGAHRLPARAAAIRDHD